MNAARILYCNCTFADVVPRDVRSEVLRALSDSGCSFDAVADLCDMSARKDPVLERLAESGCARIVACHPRAVKWLFQAAGAPLPEAGVELLNMREQAAGEIVRRLFRSDTDGKDSEPS